MVAKMMEIKTVLKCIICQKAGLLRCSKCKLFTYCGRDCQVAHFPTHKSICKHIRISKEAIDEEKDEMCRSNPENYFEDNIGRFWEVLGTRKYMDARFQYFHFLEYLTEESTAALLEAIKEGKELLRLWRQDGHGVRYHMAVIYLRIGSYEALQNCYDHIKWFDTYDMKETRYDWSNMTLPYLDISGADMCEDVYDFADNVCLYDMVALLVIKKRLMWQISWFSIHTNLVLQATTCDTSPMLLFRGNQGVLLTLFSFMRPNLPCFAGHSLNKLMNDFCWQADRITQTVLLYRNPHIWKMLVNPYKVRLAPLPVNKQPKGSVREAVAVAKLFLMHIFDDSDEAFFMCHLLQSYVGANPQYDIY